MLFWSIGKFECCVVLDTFDLAQHNLSSPVPKPTGKFGSNICTKISRSPLRDWRGDEKKRRCMERRRRMMRRARRRRRGRRRRRQRPRRRASRSSSSSWIWRRGSWRLVGECGGENKGRTRMMGWMEGKKRCNGSMQESVLS